ncbi:hypothetical protein [Thiorhodovibrio frisius]|uniref:Uncharacterized protein n=1 Tax=Thiorhodovibrio frisius TaxID=631362 RepID=H8Z654_9GAMM|nr:hypothetical protein [Thiorhodovibrio frisius]EIC19621.1 hypothetical protein Thi970DRAFT_03208 [Thiorhodovibrio frisius]WPL20413.1 hypothetical protein Thiofri_00503 [Thiorhodovibrio frisius]
MNRRQWLKALGAGLLWPIGGGPARAASNKFPTPLRPLEPRPTATPFEANNRVNLAALLEPSRSCCIGLGTGARHFIQTLKRRTDIDQVELMAQSALEPRAVTDWLHAQVAPGDYVVVVIDASDPRAVADLARHAPDWRPPECVYCVAVVINQPAHLASVPWNATEQAALDRAFDAVIEPAPGMAAAQRLAIQLLIDGTLLLSRTPIGYDPGDIRECLKRTKQFRTAATVWHRPDQRERALQRLRQRGLAHPPGDLLAFVHAGKGLSIQEFFDLMGELEMRLPVREEAVLVASGFLHEDWPRDRRVLGVTG